jgi:hypothetical protein
MSPGYRRAVDIVAEPGRVVAEIEDDFHHFVVNVEHDGRTVTSANAQAVRYPWSSCAMAGSALAALRGLPISTDPVAIYRFSDPFAQCTHMLETAGLAVTRAALRQGHRRYDAFVGDPQDGRQIADLLCDGVLQLRWRIEDGVIVAPPPFAGRRPEAFRTAVVADMPHDTAEAALILRRAVWLAGSRTFDVDRFPDAAAMGRPGVCFTYQPQRAGSAARRYGSVRDFSDGPGPLAPAPQTEETEP